MRLTLWVLIPPKSAQGAGRWPLKIFASTTRTNSFETKYSTRPQARPAPFFILLLFFTTHYIFSISPGQ